MLFRSLPPEERARVAAGEARWSAEVHGLVPDLALVDRVVTANGAAPAEGETVGVAITVPDLNQVLRQMDGRLLPLGWWKFLTKARRIDRVRVGFLGVKPEYQHTGVAAKMFVEHFDMAEVRPQKHGEMGWILETNKGMNRAMEGMGGRIVKRYRVYERVWADTAEPTPEPAAPTAPAEPPAGD